MLPPLILLVGGGSWSARRLERRRRRLVRLGLGPLEIVVLLANLLSGLLAAAYLATRREA